MQQAQEEGVPLLTGGRKPPHLASIGYFIEPTVFTEVERHHTLWTEEVFGPVMGVTAFETEEQAIELANDTNFGLAAAVISKDEEVRLHCFLQCQLCRKLSLKEGQRMTSRGMHSSCHAHCHEPFRPQQSGTGPYFFAKVEAMCG